MNRSLLVTGISLFAGITALALVFGSNRSEPDRPARADPGLYFDTSAATEDRIAALEAVVAEERNARLLLEDELQALYAELEALADDRTASDGTRLPAVREPPEDFSEFPAAGGPGDGEDRLGLLVDAGFSADRAQWILTRESELQMAQMRAIFEARQNGTRPEPAAMNPDRALREELGDLQYEQYLEATGRPTSVKVATVLESSPGQRAGLQNGDEIVAYGGERVFSYSDLSNAIMGRQIGQSVVVDVMRDGTPMQVVIDSGPIGISGRDGRIRPRR